MRIAESRFSAAISCLIAVSFCGLLGCGKPSPSESPDGGDNVSVLTDGGNEVDAHAVVDASALEDGSAVEGEDASNPEVEDAGTDEQDAALQPEDAGMDEPDAAVEPGDAGTDPQDAAISDASEGGQDASAEVADAAVNARDSGAGAEDSGHPGVDAGQGGADAGALPDASGHPADQYSNIEHLRDAQLVSALKTKVKSGHTSVGYDGAKVEMFGANGLDVHNGKVVCVYTGEVFNPSQLDKTGGYNVEHSWPQSEFGNESTTAKADMHHLFPTERDINSCRSSFPFGETDSPSGSNCSRGGSERGPIIGGSATVFEVRLAKRGDMARAHFYFAVRYGLRISSTEENTLRTWHQQDPVDAEEQARNSAIESRQHNRNPFVDRPEFVGYISDF